MGELLLWSALPLATLAAALSIAGGWTGNGLLAAVGGRAAEATAALLLISTAGLGYALVASQLKYAYVAAYVGFGDPWPVRLAALWSGPAGVALCLTALTMAAAALSFRLARTRSGAARTGALAVLGLIGILLVVTRARPFFQPDVPSVTGAGLPIGLTDIVWHLEIWMAMLAAVSAAFAFASVIGEQISESPGARSGERSAVRWSAAFLGAALMAATWRAYVGTGHLLDARGLAVIAVHVPGWLIAFAYLHAPGGHAVPGWAARWRSVLAVALFPTAMGGVVSLLAGAGAVPPAVIWSGGLAVGITAGALAGLGRRHVGAESLRQVPGYGFWAFEGGLAGLSLAGMTVVWGLVRGSLWENLGPALILVTIAGVCAWAVSRPAGAWRRVWIASVGLGVISATVVFFAAGRDGAFALACGLAAAMLIGFAADLVRLRAVRTRIWTVEDDSPATLIASRSRRRWSSAVAHLGLALMVAGLAANGLTTTESAAISPGESLVLRMAGGETRAVYLGLSRYQVGAVDKRVASFSLYRGDSPPQLVVASLSYDPVMREQFRVPFISRGALNDVGITIRGLRGGEDILCSLSARPLANLLWFGWILLLSSVVIVGRTEP
jgi:cytochrome c-type biogenesis protein CcmF